MPTYQWDPEKNDWLRSNRGVTFEDVVAAIDAGGILDLVAHPNPARYPNQRIFVVVMQGFAWLVPHVEDEHSIFLKTIIPSRKATHRYLGGGKMIAEQQISDEEYLQSFGRDEWRSVANLDAEMARHRRIAAEWISANPVVRVTLPKSDYDRLQARAQAQGASCEAVVAELIRRFVEANISD